VIQVASKTPVRAWIGGAGDDVVRNAGHFNVKSVKGDSSINTWHVILFAHSDANLVYSLAWIVRLPV
jgi:hypothetical protein